MGDLCSLLLGGNSSCDQEHTNEAWVQQPAMRSATCVPLHTHIDSLLYMGMRLSSCGCYIRQSLHHGSSSDNDVKLEAVGQICRALITHGDAHILVKQDQPAQPLMLEKLPARESQTEAEEQLPRVHS